MFYQQQVKRNHNYSLQACSYKEFLSLIQVQERNWYKDFIIELSRLIKRRTAFVLYLVLFRLSEKSVSSEHTLSLSYKKIARLINTDTSTALRNVVYLKAMGFLEVIQHGSREAGFPPNIIKVRFPKYLFETYCKKENH